MHVVYVLADVANKPKYRLYTRAHEEEGIIIIVIIIIIINPR